MIPVSGSRSLTIGSTHHRPRQSHTTIAHHPPVLRDGVRREALCELYDAKHRHIVDTIVMLHESAGNLDPTDLSQFSEEELLAIVARIGAECIALEDRHAVLEAALGPFIEELNKNRGSVKLLKISRLLRRPEEGPDASVAYRSLRKWYELVEDAEVFDSGQKVKNRRNARLLQVVKAAAEESAILAESPELRPEARTQALTHSQIVRAWWASTFKRASNHAMAVPALMASLVGIKMAGGAVAGSSGSAVGGGILGLSTAAQVAAGVTVVAVASTVVVAAQPTETPSRTPQASSIRRDDRVPATRDPIAMGTPPPPSDYPLNVVPYMVTSPTPLVSLSPSITPLSMTPTTSASSSATVAASEHPPLHDVTPEVTQKTTPPAKSTSPTAAPKSASAVPVTNQSSLEPTHSAAPSSRPAPTPTPTPTPTPSPSPTSDAAPATTTEVTPVADSAKPTGEAGIPAEESVPTFTPTPTPTSIPSPTPSELGLLDTLLQAAKTIF